MQPVVIFVNYVCTLNIRLLGISLTVIFTRVAREPCVVRCFEKVRHPCCRKTGVAQYSYWTTGYTTEELGFDLHLRQKFFKWVNPALGPGHRIR